MSPGLAAVAASQGGIFSAADANRHGYDRRDIAARVRRGEWQRLRHGVYTTARGMADAGDATGRHRLFVRAELLKVGHAVASHSSAACLLGASLMQPPQRVTLSSPVAEVRARHALQVLQVPLRENDRRLDAEGVPTTSGARTAVDLARTLPFVDAVVAVDSLLHLELALVSDLGDALEQARQWRGSRQAGRVISFADGRSESAGESWTRVLMAELGLPTPVPQKEVIGISGKRYRGDLVLEAERTIIEFDGRIKYDASDIEQARRALAAEKRREDDLRAAGWLFVRLEWSDLYRPDVVRFKISSAILTAAAQRRVA